MASVFGSMVDSLTLGNEDAKLVKTQTKSSTIKRKYLPISSDYEATKTVVIGAMLFPRDADLQVSYSLRNRWAPLTTHDATHTISSADLRDLLNSASRQELSEAASDGTKRGTVAGDLLCLIYEQSQCGKPWPSMRAALVQYREFAIDKKYGDGDSLKISDQQLRNYFEAAAPSAHLWAAHRLLKNIKDRGKSYKTAFTAEGMPLLLGVAKELQDFAATFIPKGTKPAKSIIDMQDMLHLPETIAPVKLPLRVL